MLKLEMHCKIDIRITTYTRPALFTFTLLKTEMEQEGKTKWRLHFGL